MSRKHFQELAYHIKFIEDLQARKTAAEAVADACKILNRAFDRQRFLTACGV